MIFRDSIFVVSHTILVHESEVIGIIKIFFRAIDLNP